MESRPDGHVRITGAPLSRLLRLAYGVQDHAIVAPPAWASDRFDITATAAPGSRPDDVLGMMRTLLEERFALRVGQEMRERPAFVITRNRGAGPRLRRSQGCGSECGFRAGPGHLEGRGVTLDALAATLSTPLGRPVVVEGSTGDAFDLSLDWDPSAADPVAGLIEALDRQLGLTVVDQSRAVPVLVIQSVRPLA
jgi:uncharacterized protein (TIGR03435 family)